MSNGWNVAEADDGSDGCEQEERMLHHGAVL